MFDSSKQKNKITNRNNFKKGFTLIELLVSVGLFSVVVTITMGSILMIVDTNRKSQTLTLVMNNMGFALESMTRTIKTSTKVIKGSPLVFLKPNLEGGNDEYVRYKFNDETKTIEICKSDSSTSCNNFASILSSEVVIEHFNLELFDGLKNQPRILMTVGGYAQLSPRIKSEFNIQTTVSPRRLDLSNGSD